MYTNKLPIQQVKALNTCERHAYDLAMNKKRSAEFVEKHSKDELNAKRRQKAAEKRLKFQQECNTAVETPVFLNPLPQQQIPAPVPIVAAPMQTVPVTTRRQTRAQKVAANTPATVAPVPVVAAPVPVVAAPKPPRKQRADQQQPREAAQIANDFTSKQLVDMLQQHPRFKTKDGSEPVHNSYTTYRSSIRKMFSLGNCTTIFGCLRGDDGEGYKRILDKIEKSDGLVNTKKATYQSMLLMFDQFLKEHMEKAEFDKMKKAINLKHREADHYSREETRWRVINETVPKTDVYLKRVKDAYGEASKEYLLCYLYLKGLCCRDNYKEMHLVHKLEDANDDEKNYMVIHDNPHFCQIILNEYKTSAHYDTIKYTLNFDNAEESKLYDLLTDWINKKTDKQQKYVFGTSSESSTLSKINKALGYIYKGNGKQYKQKSVGGVNFLRHIVVSSHLTNKKLSYAEKVEIADSMGHSIVTQATYERQIEYDDEEE